MLVVVINPAGVNLRTAPTTAATRHDDVLPAGEVLEISHIATIGKDKWGKVKDQDRQYIALTQGGTQYCTEMVPV